MSRVATASLALLLLPSLASAGPRFEIAVEAASAWQSRNEVQIPNEPGATRFSLVDLLGSGPVPAVRVDLRWNTGERHQLHALLAPFRFEAEGTPSTAIRFAGTDFDAGTPATGTYRFNSWRIGYRYRYHDGPRGDAWVGFTAKLRDAEIRLEQAGRSANDTDLGFVPLLHLAGRYYLAERWTASAELEALGGGPGRAIDAAAELRYGPRDHWGISAGYRTIEGGADVDAVYNFAWLHFAYVGVDFALR